MLSPFSSDCIALRRLLLLDADSFAITAGEFVRSPADGVDPPVATAVSSLVPVEVDSVGGDDVPVVEAAGGVWLAVACLVELGSGVPAVPMAVWVWMTVVCPVEVDSGGGRGVVVASVVVSAEVVVGGFVLKQYLTGGEGREGDP